MIFTKKKILVFSDWFLPGFKAGGPIRSLANLVNSLDHEFFIVTRITDHHSSKPYPNIPSNTWVDISSSVHVYYLDENSINDATMRRLIKERNYDKLYFNSLFSPKFTLLPLRVARQLKLRQRCVLAPRGMLKAGALSIKSNKKKIFLAASRWLGWFAGIRWHATNEQEAQEIRLHYGSKSNVVIAPNLATVIQNTEQPIAKEENDLRLICIARISPEKGILEAIQFLKDAQLSGHISCAFYGTQQNAEYLQQCKTLAESIPEVNIQFPGEIEPHVIASALEKAHFFYLTTWGENFGHAIAEALQHGKPVIISNRTPWKNLEVERAGWDLPLDATSFATMLRLCLQMKQDTYNTWSTCAKQFGMAHAQDPKHVSDNYRLFE
jgi:glycosyltransferase involved in cell wall biosynthesis